MMSIILCKYMFLMKTKTIRIFWMVLESEQRDEVFTWHWTVTHHTVSSGAHRAVGYIIRHKYTDPHIRTYKCTHNKFILALQQSLWYQRQILILCVSIRMCVMWAGKMAVTESLCLSICLFFFCFAMTPSPPNHTYTHTYIYTYTHSWLLI